MRSKPLFYFMLVLMNLAIPITGVKLADIQAIDVLLVTIRSDTIALLTIKNSTSKSSAISLGFWVIGHASS
jgi:hypothetical protein